MLFHPEKALEIKLLALIQVFVFKSSNGNLRSLNDQDERQVRNNDSKPFDFITTENKRKADSPPFYLEILFYFEVDVNSAIHFLKTRFCVIFSTFQKTTTFEEKYQRKHKISPQKTFVEHKNFKNEEFKHETKQ